MPVRNLVIKSAPGALKFTSTFYTSPGASKTPAVNLWWYDTAATLWRRLPDYASPLKGGLKNPDFRGVYTLVLNTLTGNQATAAVPAALLTDAHDFFVTYGTEETSDGTASISEDAVTAVPTTGYGNAGDFGLKLTTSVSAEIHAGSRITDKRVAILTSETSSSLGNDTITITGGVTNPATRGVVVGMQAKGENIPDGATVIALGGTTIQLSAVLATNPVSGYQTFDFWSAVLDGIYTITTDPAAGDTLVLDRPLAANASGANVTIYSCPVESVAAADALDMAPDTLALLYPGQLVHHIPESSELELPEVTIGDIHKDAAGQTYYTVTFGNQDGVCGYYIASTLYAPGTTSEVFSFTDATESTFRVYAAYGTNADGSDEYTRTERDYTVRAPVAADVQDNDAPPDASIASLNFTAVSPLVGLIDEETSGIVSKLTFYAGDSVRIDWALVTSRDGVLIPWRGFNDPGSTDPMELSTLTMTVIGTHINLPDVSSIDRTGNVYDLHESLVDKDLVAVAGLPTDVEADGPYRLRFDITDDVDAIDWTHPILVGKVETSFRLLFQATFAGTPDTVKTVLDILMAVKKNS